MTTKYQIRQHSNCAVKLLLLGQSTQHVVGTMADGELKQFANSLSRCLMPTTRGCKQYKTFQRKAGGLIVAIRLPTKPSIIFTKI